MKTFIIILSLILVGIAAIFFLKGCPKANDSKDRAIDSLTFALHTDSLQYARRSSLADNTIKGLVADLDTTRRALDSIRKKFNVRGKQILATNKDLHAALIIHDTPQVYKDAEYLAFQIDSISELKWNEDRELDRQQVLNEQLRYTDSMALADCRGTLRKREEDDDRLVLNYEVQHQQDAKALKQQKHKGWFFGFVGAIIGGGIRSFIK